MHTQSPPIGAILKLAAMQIEVALQTTESQVGALSDSVAAIAVLAATLPQGCAEAVVMFQRHAREATVAMQYHDQLTQRLAHVRDALTDLQHALANSMGPDDWHRVLVNVRSRFSMEDERLLFDRILAWPTDETSRHRVLVADSARGCVELF